MKHISLETAKKLHSLGYAMRTMCHWYVPRTAKSPYIRITTDLDERLITIRRSDGTKYYEDDSFAAPLAEELLEVLPRSVTYTDYDDEQSRANLTLYTYEDSRMWEVCYDKGYDSGSVYEAESRDLTEALALLLIELVEQGIVSRESLSIK